MALRPARKSKLEVDWEGPIEIIDKLSETNYALKMSGRQKQVKIYYRNLVKLFDKGGEVINVTLKMSEELPSGIPEWKKISLNSECNVEKFKTISVNAKVLESAHVNDLKELVSESR